MKKTRIRIGAGGFFIIEAMEPRVLLSGGPRIVWSDLRDTGDSGRRGAISVIFDRPVAPIGFNGGVVRAVEDESQRFVLSSSRVDSTNTRHTLTFYRLQPGGDPAPAIAESGRYTLTLFSGDGLVEGTDGADLDGEMSASGDLPSGDGAAGGDFQISFSVFPFGSPPPSPKELTAMPLSSSEIELRWWDDTNYEYNFVVERAEGDGAFVQIAKPVADGGAATFIDKSVVRGQTYRYRMRSERATDSGPLFSPWSDTVAAQVLPEEMTLPLTGLVRQYGYSPDWLTKVGGAVYFTWSTPQAKNQWHHAAGKGLWKTDGTEHGTLRLLDARVGSLIEFEGKLYFAGEAAATGLELWTSDGTVEGTQLAVDVRPGTASSSPRMLGTVGGRLFFGVPTVGKAHELWSTDGTAAGTTMVPDALVYLDRVPEGSDDARRLFTVSGGSLYFRRATADGGDASELWRTDGTDAGTVHIPEVSDPSWLTNVGQTLFVASNAQSYPLDPLLYKVAAGSSSATLVKRFINSTGYGILKDLAAVGDLLFFAGEPPKDSIKQQIWRSDGTEAGTFFMDHSLASRLRVPHQIADLNGEAFFLTHEVNLNSRFGTLVHSDGTKAGTLGVRPFEGRHGNSPFFGLVAGGLYVYSDHLDLWRSDGTRAGTYKVNRTGDDVLFSDEPLYWFSGNTSLAVGDDVHYGARVGRWDEGRELRVASFTTPAAPADVGLVDGLAGSDLPKEPSAVGAPAGAPAGGVTVTWSDDANNESGYVVDRMRTAGGLPLETHYAPAGATSLHIPSASAGDGYIYRVRSFNAGGFSEASLSQQVWPDVSAVFQYEGRPAIGMTFSDGMGSLADLRLRNLTTGQDVPASLIERVHDAGSTVAVYTFPGYARGVLPDGVYSATLGAGATLNADHVFEFFVLAGDADRDRRVSIADYLRIDRGFSRGSAGFSNGDFDYSGVIDAADYFVIDQAYLAGLDQPAAVAEAAPTQPTGVHQENPGAVAMMASFSQTTIDDDDDHEADSVLTAAAAVLA